MAATDGLFSNMYDDDIARHLADLEVNRQYRGYLQELFIKLGNLFCTSRLSCDLCFILCWFSPCVDSEY